jgi:hypothetical protein
MSKSAHYICSSVKRNKTKVCISAQTSTAMPCSNSSRQFVIQLPLQQLTPFCDLLVMLPATPALTPRLRISKDFSAPLIIKNVPCICHTDSLFGWLVADGWCWFLLREEYCWLVAAGCWWLVRSERKVLLAGG